MLVEESKKHDIVADLEEYAAQVGIDVADIIRGSEAKDFLKVGLATGSILHIVVWGVPPTQWS